jgi:hypothetical protein
VEEVNPSYYRARIAALKKLIQETRVERDEKNPDRVLLRNGFIPENLQAKFDEIRDNEYLLTFSLNEPLTFVEIISFNTWFAMHPEKICGKETVTTSREFPISVKGTKEEIIQAISQKSKDKSQIEPEPEQNITSNIEQPTSENEVIPIEKDNRFGNAADALNLTVADFNELYFSEYEKLQVLQKPLEEQYAKLKEQLKSLGKDKVKKKEISDKQQEITNQLNQNKNEFDEDWWNYNLSLQNHINKIAAEKGLDIPEGEESIYSDDILLAITERPGIEQYWTYKIKDVINEIVDYYLKQNNTESKEQNHLELEALAIEVELELLKI